MSTKTHIQRCKWSEQTPDFYDYHDNEWGYPVDDDVRLFEKLCLESFQSGLSWRTILAKRENFRLAFKGFDVKKVAKFTTKDIERLLQNEGIVRHRGKIEATINNAQRMLEVIQEFGSFAAYVWQFEPATNQNSQAQMVSTSTESIAMSKDLKKRGWKFVGPTTVYAFMQAMGLINDHTLSCDIRKKTERARKHFQRPKMNK